MTDALNTVDAALAAVEIALKRNPDNATLRARRAALLRECARVAAGGDAETLRRRLEELEDRMAVQGVVDTKLVREHERLRRALHAAERV